MKNEPNEITKLILEALYAAGNYCNILDGIEFEKLITRIETENLDVSLKSRDE